MLLCLEDTVLLERDRAFLGEDGSFSWLPMARGHRGVHTEGSELSCHGPGGGTHCGEEKPGQGPLREGTSTLPAWRPPYPQPSMPTDSPTAQPCCPHPRAEEGSLPRRGSAVRCPRASVSPGGAGAPPGAGSCARCRPALPRLTSPARRVQSPVRTPRLPLLAHPPGSPADTGQQQPRPRPKAESIGTVRGSPRRPAAATPTPLR